MFNEKLLCRGYPSSSLDGGMHETIFQIHAANLPKLGKGKSDGLFQTSHECKLLKVAPPLTKRIAIGRYKTFASYCLEIHCWVSSWPCWVSSGAAGSVQKYTVA